MPLGRLITALSLGLAIPGIAPAQAPPSSAVDRAQQSAQYAEAPRMMPGPSVGRSAPAQAQVATGAAGDIEQATYAAPLPAREKTRITRGPADDGTVGGDEADEAPHPRWLATFASLAAVLGLFFAVVWLMRRGAPATAQQLPAEAFVVLGRAALAPRLHAHLVRCGNKLLLVAVSAAGAETLTEITEPLEVDRLAGLCTQTNPHGATAAFRQIFQQFAGEKVSGFAGDSRGRGRKAPLDEEAD